MDTTNIGGKRCINLAFFPRSKADLNFEGNLYITDDSTYNFIDGTPYMEAGFGISNIFKIIRIDAVRRLNYLDHPNVSKWRIQGQFLFDF